MSEWFKEAVLKTAVRQRTVGSNPTLSATFFIYTGLRIYPSGEGAPLLRE